MRLLPFHSASSRGSFAAAAIQKLALRLGLLGCFGAMPLAMTKTRTSSRGGLVRRGDPERKAASIASGLLRFARNDVIALIAALFLAFSFAPAFAVDPAEQLKDTKLEARAREISAGLRCLVCQNQSIDDSDAPLARDLRQIVRQQLQKGASNGQVVEYVVDRYGEFVLLNPRLHLNTLILWLTPLLLVAGGVVLAARIVRRKPEKAGAPPLSPEEQKELDKLLAQPPAKS